MEYNSPKFKKWLNTLQQESWQLELIISGFAIYGLFAAIDPVDLKIEIAYINESSQIGFLWLIVAAAQYILIFNLVLHILLRGLWIGAIGLRYVSGDIDYQSLNYSEKFTNFLQKKVGSFDLYIAKLENYCSILFAITFLLIFYIIGTVVAIYTIGYIFSSIASTIPPSVKIVKFLTLFLLFIVTLSSITVLIDFIGQGVLKRKKWTSKIYFPIYRIFGFITLSFLYRPLIYNFLDNKLGKRISLFLFPVYVAIVLLYGLNYRPSNYLGINYDSSQYELLIKHYDDIANKEKIFTDIASIPSKIIEKPYLHVFFHYKSDIEDFIFEKNESLKPRKDKRGYYSELITSFIAGTRDASGKKEIVELKSYLETVNSIYSLEIDSKNFKSDFVISSNTKERLGFETYLNIKKLEEGKHILTITGPAKENQIDPESKTIEKVLVTIPFWYYPENSSSQNVQNTIILKDTVTTH